LKFKVALERFINSWFTVSCSLQILFSVSRDKIESSYGKQAISVKKKSSNSLATSKL